MYTEENAFSQDSDNEFIHWLWNRFQIWKPWRKHPHASQIFLSWQLKNFHQNLKPYQINFSMNIWATQIQKNIHQTRVDSKFPGKFHLQVFIPYFPQISLSSPSLDGNVIWRDTLVRTNNSGDFLYFYHCCFVKTLHYFCLTHLRLVLHIYCIYMYRWTGSALVQVTAWHRGAKPLPEPMLAYCQLDSWEQISVKFESEYYHFHWRKCFWNCYLPKWRPFHSTTQVSTIKCWAGWELRCSIYHWSAAIFREILSALQNSIISMASCKTAVNPLCKQWKYCSLALSHRSDLWIFFLIF